MLATSSLFYSGQNANFFHGNWWQVLLFLVGFSGSLVAQSLPSGFASSQVQAGYNTSVGIIISPDGRQFFVWEKSGRVYVSTWNGSAYVHQNAPILDINEEVGN